MQHAVRKYTEGVTFESRPRCISLKAGLFILPAQEQELQL